MEAPNLNTLQVGQELNPLAYASGDYPTKDAMLDYIMSHMDDDPVEINLTELSVNGEVVKDDMQTYLSKKHIGSSGLKECLKSPRAFYYDYVKQFKEQEKPYFELGTFAHMAFLEPELFDMVKVAPDVNLASKDGVIKMINFYQELNSDVISFFDKTWKMADLKERMIEEKKKCKYQIIQPDHFAIIEALRKNYEWYGGGIIKQILKGARAEVSFYGIHESTGLGVKVRPDFFNIAENIGVNAVISFKTTRCDNINHFIYNAAQMKYELSEGMYQEIMTSITGRQFNVTIMIMMQTVAPYDVAVLWWDAEDLQLGKYKFENSIQTVKECFEQNWFPGFDANAESGSYGIIDMKLPEWAMKELAPVDVEI